MEEAEAEAEAIQRCSYWLSKKNRFCANSPITNSQFCGNHNPKSDEQRIPCPIDPSHTVLQGNIDAHVKRCPFLKQGQSLRMHPFFKEGINAGTDDDQNGEESVVTTATMKRDYVFKMSVSEFVGLIEKIELIHKSLCSNLKDSSYKIRGACREWMNEEINGKLPFQEKHVLQQASILGNLEEFGVLEPPEKRSVSDNGSMGSDEAIPAVADRSLRQKESLVLERLRIDIEDLDLNSIEALSAAPYLAIGKHLCGPATVSMPETVRTTNTSHLRGLAVAACCHHLCQWKHYINKNYLSNLGIKKEEFHAVTWFTSWAVDAAHGSDLSNMVERGSSLDSIISISGKSSHHMDAGSVEEIVRTIPAIERAALGFMCKDIIDIGRLMWLKDLGLEAELVKYVPSNISPENHLLIAKSRNYS
ncbi:hypothetical protein Syun_011680 [Stephania yunnanensis]|uniref:tRNA:m(4)X modification enzyme TRM13 n=1 Tax=Stephania yunnanensis TaxID=152371 RepID=A0AAP0JZ11_9MAGN